MRRGKTSRFITCANWDPAYFSFLRLNALGSLTPMVHPAYHRVPLAKHKCLAVILLLRSLLLPRWEQESYVILDEVMATINQDCSLYRGRVQSGFTG